MIMEGWGWMPQNHGKGEDSHSQEQAGWEGNWLLIDSIYMESI